MAAKKDTDSILAVGIAKEQIRSCFSQLVEQLRVQDFRDKWYQEGIVEYDDVERINSECTSRDKASKALHIIMNKPGTEVLKFITCLREDESCSHLVKMIDSQNLSNVMGRTSEGNVMLEHLLKEALIPCTGGDSRISVADLIQYLQCELKANGWPLDVSHNSVCDAIKTHFPEVQVWESSPERKLKKKKKKKGKTCAGTHLNGVKWKPHIREVRHFKTTEIPEQEEEVTQDKAVETVPSESSTVLDAWTKEQVAEWLGSIGQNSNVIDCFLEGDVTGYVLKALTRAEVKEIVPDATFGISKAIVLKRDELLLSNEKTISLKPQVMVEEAPGQAQNRRMETFCKFDANVNGSSHYVANSYLPPADQNPTDLIRPIHHYVSMKDPSDTGNINTFTKEMLEFACACLNGRCNGTIHFGVDGSSSEEQGKITGVYVVQSDWLDAFAEAIKKFVPADEQDVVEHCVRAPRFVDVIDRSDDRLSAVVVEVDVVPHPVMCANEVFWVRQVKSLRPEVSSDSAKIFHFVKGRPRAVRQTEMKKVYDLVKKLSATRAEAQRVQKAIRVGSVANTDLRRRLVQCLCQGESSMDGDIFPILVTSPIGSDVSQEELKERFSFLKDMQWKMVFDFDDAENESSLFRYLEDTEQQVLKVLPVEDFDKSSQENMRKTARFENVLRDLRLSSHRPWVFANGCAQRDDQPMSVVKWKRNRSKGFKEAVRFLEIEIPRGRAVIVFLLMSKDYEVMLEAADELCTKFGDIWFVLAESEEICDSWRQGIVQRNILEERAELDKRCIVGMPWAHVNETIHQVMRVENEGTCELPTSTGAFVILRDRIKNDLVDLDILGANQCSNHELNDDEEKLQEQAHEVEQQFYRGGCVDWWNFHFQNQVLRRAIHDELHSAVKNVLASGENEDERIGRVTLYHQPGSGGSTTARHVLWELRKEYRCAIVKEITDQTLDQVIRLHKYEDQQNPKPVLLLFDNHDDVKISNLRAELEEEVRQICRRQHSSTQTVFFVFLVCLRRTLVPVFIDPYRLVLKQVLQPQELIWLKTKYQQLEEKFKENAKKGMDPRHLISFNILKENFDPAYSKKTVEEFVKEITNPRERALLKFMAMLNAYDLEFQYISVSAFDDIMGEPGATLTQRWELHLSQPLKILLNQNSRPGKGQQVRIISNILPKIILLSLMTRDDGIKELLGDVMISFLESPIFSFVYADQSVEQLKRKIRDIVKKRARKPDGFCETHFALLIQEIVEDDKQSIPKAAEVMQRVFNMTDDVFVAQQIARLYIYSKNWEEAAKFGKITTNMMPNNSYIWDTMARVYKEQVAEHYDKCLKGDAKVYPQQALEVLELAIRAVDTFHKEQKVSEEEKMKTFNNNAGYLGEITVIVQLLDYLNYVEGFEDRAVLHQFLVGGSDAIPNEVRWAWTPELIARVRALQDGAKNALARLEDEYLHLRDGAGDDIRKNVSRVSDDYLIKMKENIENYYGEESDRVPNGLSDEEACKYRRRRVFRLAGTTFRGIFELRKQDEGEEKLLKIKRLMEENMRSVHKDAFDMQALVSVKLTLCAMKDVYKVTIKHKDVARLSNELYMLHEGRNCLEPFLFALMLNWPRSGMDFTPPLPISQFSEVVRTWKEAYFKKYPRQREECRPYRKKETTLFFFGQGRGMSGILNVKDLHPGDLRVRRTTFWRSLVALKRLERFEGTLLTDGMEVQLRLEQAGNKVPLKIPTSFPIGNRSMWNKRVYFVIGFSWVGPKAYDVDTERPTLQPTERQSASGHTNLRVRGKGLPFLEGAMLGHAQFRSQMSNIQKKLDGIAQLKQFGRNRSHAAQQKLLHQERELNNELSRLSTSRQQFFQLELM